MPQTLPKVSPPNCAPAFGFAETRSRRPAVSARALIIGAAITPINVLLSMRCYYRWAASAPIGISLATNTVTLLFLLVLLNQVLKRWRPAWVLQRGELLTLYAMLGISTALMDWGPWLPLTIAYPFSFANPENGWQQLMWPSLPNWLTVQNKAVLEGLWVGRTNPYLLDVIKIWLTPALWWTSFISAAIWVFFCLNSIVRRRWADEEKLQFPLVILPVQMADERFGLLQNKAWWAGFAIAFILEVWNDLHS